jgi:SH3-like domain-containing protein
MTMDENQDTAQTETYAIDEKKHATGQRNVLGTIIDCRCDWCEAKIAQIEGRNRGHKIQGVG